MKPETAQKIRECVTFKTENYDTPRGRYHEAFMLHLKTGDLYWMKVKDGELCELLNLSEKLRKAGSHRAAPTEQKGSGEG